MSRHVSRSQRWQRISSLELRSGPGLRVFYEKRAWWGEVSYRLLPEQSTTDRNEREAHTDRLGPFRRERNAMVEAERHATMLANRFGERLEWGAG